MKFFPTEEAAVEAAQKLKMVGLYSSGQECGPEYHELGWFYRTAHSAFGGEPMGEIILPGRVLHGTEAIQFVGWLMGYEEPPE